MKALATLTVNQLGGLATTYSGIVADIDTALVAESQPVRTPTNRLHILANRGESGPSAPRAFRIYVYQINNI